MVGLVLELQGGYTKYLCFLYLWDSWTCNQHYVRQEWPLRQRLKPGSHKIQSHPLIEPNKVLLLSLHIKLRVMKNLGKAAGLLFSKLPGKPPECGILEGN